MREAVRNSTLLMVGAGGIGMFFWAFAISNVKKLPFLFYFTCHIGYPLSSYVLIINHPASSNIFEIAK